METQTYSHTQRGPWWILVLALAVILTVVGFVNWDHVFLRNTLMIGGLLIVLIGGAFAHLTVEDDGRQLVLRFGPLNLLQRRIWYDDIVSVEKGRTTCLEGWGINLSLRGGWVWNIWGFDCVVLKLKRGVLRIGTDDRDGLAEFLAKRLASRDE